MIYFIFSGLVLFVIKRFLMRTKLFSRDLINDLKKQNKEQQDIIIYQTNKILELQNIILNNGRRVNE